MMLNPFSDGLGSRSDLQLSHRDYKDSNQSLNNVKMVASAAIF